MSVAILRPMEPQHGLGPPPAYGMPPGSFAMPAPMPPQDFNQPRGPVPNSGFQQIQHQHRQQLPGSGPRGRPQQQQQHQQQQTQQKGLGPRTSRGKKRKHRWHNKQGQKDSGLQSLAALSAQNRRRAQQHFGNETPMSEAPRTVPHAPHNDNSFILSQHGRGSFSGDMTPAEPSGNVQWTPAHNSAAADYSSLDKDAADLGAQLDFFGTNEGLVARYSSEDDSSDGEGDGSEMEGELHHGWRLRSADEAEGALPSYVRERLSDQAAYISKLEAQNLNLQERYSLLQHELQELKAARTTAAAASTPAAAAIMSEAATAAAADTT